MKTRCLVALIAIFPATLTFAEYRNLGSVHDGSGGVSTNTVLLGGVEYKHANASGQPGGIATNAGGPWINSAGFLQAVDIKRPGLDSDGDGVIDELDPDNDNDNLADLAEVGGSGFNPPTATDVNDRDSDKDGMIDGQEADAGTNPTDANSLLEIISVGSLSENRLITWQARADGLKQYVVMVSDAQSFAAPAQAIATNTYSGGAAPWYEADVVYTNAGSTSNRYYSIKALP